MRIAAYVVSDPSSNEEIVLRMLRAIADAKPAKLVLKSVDISPCEEREVEFGVRQVDVDDFGQRHFIGILFEDGERMIINVFVPMWDEETKVKISSYPFQD